MKLYGEISKTEEADDGTIKVWGYASSGSRDEQGETITAKAMQDALPDYMKWANVREMHTAKAAGNAIEASVQDDGRCWFGAHIVDLEAVRKVKMGVYKGFSIGGRVTKRNAVDKSIIEGLRVNEVSLVDRPANPESVITLMKMLDGEDAESATSVELAKASDSLAKSEADLEATKVLLKSATDEVEFRTATKDSIHKMLVGAGMEEGANHEVFLAKLFVERDELLAKKAEWEDKPQAGGPALTVVDKDGDAVSKKSTEVDPVKKSDGSIDEAATAIKKIHAAGRQVNKY